MSSSMAWTWCALKVTLGLLMVNSLIELSFISSTVAWLHFTASGTFAVTLGGSTFNLAGKPVNLMLSQGHTSNSAAGTAFMIVGLGGILTLWLRSRLKHALGGRFGVILHSFWIGANVAALLLTLAALAYVFTVTNAYAGQAIDLNAAAALGGAGYRLGTWTPQTWFAAVLQLPLADGDVRADIASHYRVMLGWQYNLIPMFLIQLAETAFAGIDYLQRLA